jgi:type VI secretion system secreted protein Hcp
MKPTLVICQIQEDSAMKKHSAVLLVALACFFAIVNIAHSAGEAILKIDGIQGESKIHRYEGRIDLLTWSWEIDNISSPRDPASVGPIKVTKHIDKSSPSLMFMLLMGKHIRSVDLVLLATTKSETYEYLKIEMTDVLVVNVSSGGTSNEFRATETVSFTFGKVCYNYTTLMPNGSPGPIIEKCYNVDKNVEE